MLFKNIFFKIKYRQINRIFTHLTENEKKVLLNLSKKIRKNAVEIGSYLGASSCFIAEGIKQSGASAKCFCIDTWENDAMSEGKKETYSEFINNTKLYKNIIIPVRQKSSESGFYIEKNAGSIDFLFIDGDHSYKGCLEDWTVFSKFLTENAIIVFHDTGWADGVKKVINDLVLPRSETIEKLPNLEAYKLASKY